MLISLLLKCLGLELPEVTEQRAADTDLVRILLGLPSSVQLRVLSCCDQLQVTASLLLPLVKLNLVEQLCGGLPSES